MKYSININADDVEKLKNAIYCIDWSYGNGMDSDCEYGWDIVRPLLVKLLNNKE